MRQRTHDKGSDFTNAREGASLPHCLGFLWCSLHRSFVSPTQTNTNTNKQTQANSFLGSVNGCFGLAFLFFYNKQANQWYFSQNGKRVTLFLPKITLSLERA